MSDVLLLGLSSLGIPYRDSFEMINAFEADKFRVCQYGDVRGFFNATNEVFRHCVNEARPSDDYVHVLCTLGQENSSLPRGISTADHNDVFTVTYLRLNKSCTVINADAFKAGQILNRQLPIFGPGGDDDRARWDLDTILEFYLIGLAVAG
jgi:hypothetical protein